MRAARDRQTTMRSRPSLSRRHQTATSSAPGCGCRTQARLRLNRLWRLLRDEGSGQRFKAPPPHPRPSSFKRVALHRAKGELVRPPQIRPDHGGTASYFVFSMEPERPPLLRRILPGASSPATAVTSRPHLHLLSVLIWWTSAVPTY
jgi:hypothetical protein